MASTKKISTTLPYSSKENVERSIPEYIYPYGCAWGGKALQAAGILY